MSNVGAKILPQLSGDRPEAYLEVRKPPDNSEISNLEEFQEDSYFDPETDCTILSIIVRYDNQYVWSGKKTLARYSIESGKTPDD